jgi:hypothetical protein
MEHLKKRNSLGGECEPVGGDEQLGLLTAVVIRVEFSLELSSGELCACACVR